MELKYALQEICQTLFESPLREFWISSYLTVEIQALLAMTDCSQGEQEAEKLVQRERQIRHPLDDGGYFQVQNDIALLRCIRVLFIYAEENGGDVDFEFVAQANRIICSNHCLMDFGGYFGELGKSIETRLKDDPAGSIRIVSVPPGFAPEAIRKQWVGIRIPLATKKERRLNPPSRFGIGSSNQGGFLVLRSKAVEALRDAGRNRAADYWGDTQLGYYLQFKKEVCEQVGI